MKNNIKLIVLASALLVGGLSLNVQKEMNESTLDVLANGNGINLRANQVGTSEEITYSRTYSQVGLNVETGNHVLRFATAISGKIKSAYYTRSVEGLQDVTKQVTTVYKGIEANNNVYYFDGTDLTTEQNELTNNYYWACYSIEFATNTYKASDINVALTVEDLDGNTYNPQAKVSNLDELTSKVVEFNFDSDVENGINLASAGTVKEGRITVNGDCKGLELSEPITLSLEESFTIETTVRTGAGGVLLSTGHSTGGFLNIPSQNDDASTNGFTLRDPKRTASLLFKKDTSKLGHKKHLAMVYDKETKTIKAYEDGVEMALNNQTGNINTLQETKFTKLFGGFSTGYQYSGEVYHFKYVNRALPTSKFTMDQDEILEFNFDSAEENGYDFSKMGPVENGMLSITAGKVHELKKPITISQDKSFTFEMTVQTYDSADGRLGGVILATGDSTGGFLNVPSANNDASGNGFTLRDPKRTASLFFIKDTTKLGQKKHLVMTYNATTKTLKAYEDGVAMGFKNQTGSIDTFEETTFRYFLGGPSFGYFKADIYHFRYVDRDLAVKEFKTNQ